MNFTKGSDPLNGVIFCCTALDLETQTSIVSKGIRLGGKYSPDLTDRVTHLIAARHGSEKYKYVAKHRLDIKIMNSYWIPSLFESWLKGEDLIAQDLESKYYLKALETSVICFSNLDSDARFSLEKLCTDHGALCSSAMDHNVTHLVTPVFEERKCELAILYHIPIVHPTWVTECIKRGAVLEPCFFSPNLPKDQLGKGVYDLDSNHIQRRYGDILEEEHIEPNLRLTRKRYLERAKHDWNQVLGLQKATTNEKHSCSNFDMISSRNTCTNSDISEMSIFNECKFMIQNFEIDKIKILTAFLTTNGGKVISSTEPQNIKFSSSYFIVVPYSTSKSELKVCSENYVTDIWVERCLHLRKWESPGFAFFSTPFLPSTAPIRGLENLEISITGFSGIEHLQLKRVINLIGGKFCASFTRSRDVLICGNRNSVNGRIKLQKATSWGINVCSFEWIRGCICKGEIQPFHMFPLDFESSSIVVKDTGTPNSFILSSQQQLQISSKMLKGCKILFVNYNQDIIDEADSCGAEIIVFPRRNRLNFDLKQISHIVCEESDLLDEGIKEFLNSNRHEIKLCSSEWIRQSFETQQRLNEKDFKVFSPGIAREETSNSVRTLEDRAEFREEPTENNTNRYKFTTASFSEQLTAENYGLSLTYENPISDKRKRFLLEKLNTTDIVSNNVSRQHNELNSARKNDSNDVNNSKTVNMIF